MAFSGSALFPSRSARSNYPMLPPNPIGAIKFRVDQMGIGRKGLEGIIGSRARVAEVLAGTRALSIAMIRRPGEHHINALKDGLTWSKDVTTEGGKDYPLTVEFSQPPPPPKAEAWKPGPAAFGRSLPQSPFAFPSPVGWWIHVPMEDGKLPYWVFPREPDVPREDPPGPFRVWPVVLGGALTFGAAVTGVVYTIKARGEPDPHTKDDYQTAANLSLIGMGLLGLTTVGYTIYEDRRTSVTVLANRVTWSHQW